MMTPFTRAALLAGCFLLAHPAWLHAEPGAYLWNNALFVKGTDGGAINGSFSCYGSIHVLGGIIPPGGVAIYAQTPINTNIFIRNSYDTGLAQTLPQRVWDSIPALFQTDVNGELVSTLNANLRIKNGSVTIEDGASAGLPDEPGNQWKETLDGVYVNGEINEPGSVFSDNGVQPYDLGDSVTFPFLDDDYLDPVSGERVPHPDGGFYSWQDYFTEVLVDRPEGATEPSVLRGDLRLQVKSTLTPFSGGNPFAFHRGLESVVDGHFHMAEELRHAQFRHVQDATLSGGGILPTAVLPHLLDAQGPGPNAGNFYFNATTGEFINGDFAVADVLATLNTSNDYLLWDADAGRLRANGQIVIEGNLEILPGAGQNVTVQFTGNAAILVVDGEARGAAPDPAKGNITINTNFLSLNGDGTWESSFPSNLLSFMADRDLNLGGRSQIVQMGAFYAEQYIVINFQTHTVGSLVASNVDIGGQVPFIYQVPALAEALAPGTIGYTAAPTGGEGETEGEGEPPLPLAIGTQPANMTVNVGDDTGFVVADVTGGLQPYTFAWHFIPSGAPGTTDNVSGWDAPALSITGVNTSGHRNVGSYFCTVTDSTPGTPQSVDSNTVALALYEESSPGTPLAVWPAVAVLVVAGALVVRRRKR